MNRGTSSHQNEMLPFYVSVNNVNAQICTFHVTFTLNVYELAFMSDSEPDVSMFSSLSVDTNWYFQVKHDVFLSGWFLCLSVCNRSGEQLCVCGFRNVDYQDIFQLSGLVPHHVDAKTVNPRYCCSLTVGVSTAVWHSRPNTTRWDPFDGSLDDYSHKQKENWVYHCVKFISPYCVFHSASQIFSHPTDCFAAMN